MTAKWFVTRSCFDICKDGSKFGTLHLVDQSAHEWMMNAEYLSGRVQTGGLGAGIRNHATVCWRLTVISQLTLPVASPYRM